MNLDPQITRAPTVQPTEVTPSVGRAGTDGNTSSFNALMSPDQAGGPGAQQAVQGVAAQPQPLGPPTAANISQQIDSASQATQQIQTNLQAGQLKSMDKPSQKLLLKKLENAHVSMRGAADAAGLPAGPRIRPGKGSTLMQKMLSFAGDTQGKLASLQDQMNSVGADGKFNVAQMLSMQVKINSANQELQLGVAVMSKGLDAVKQLMNIQV